MVEPSQKLDFAECAQAREAVNGVVKWIKRVLVSMLSINGRAISPEHGMIEWSDFL